MIKKAFVSAMRFCVEWFNSTFFAILALISILMGDYVFAGWCAFVSLKCQIEELRGDLK